MLDRQLIKKVKYIYRLKFLLPLRILFFVDKRALPDFLIIGTQKSGTSSLFNYLKQHPQICSPLKKEVHYFDNGITFKKENYNRGINWYKAHFPLAFFLKKKLTFEATPSYIFLPDSISRIKKDMPHVKLIVLLRDPIDRAISQYYHNVRDHLETRDIYTAIVDHKINKHQGVKDYRLYAYKERGNYAEQLEYLFQFFPREQVMIIKSEEFFAETYKVLSDVCDFLEVANYNGFETKKVFNKGNKQPVTSKVKSYLDSYYKPKNKLLSDLLNDTKWLWGESSNNCVK